jgi:hypothetical protein
MTFPYKILLHHHNGTELMRNAAEIKDVLPHAVIINKQFI